MRKPQEHRRTKFKAKSRASDLDGEADDVLTGSLCFLVQRANRIISRQLDDALRPVGLTSRQMIILDVIGEHDTLSQSALADIVGKDHTTLTANLGPLTSRGLVESQIDGGDRRVRNISLTADGAVLLKHARHVLKTFDAALCARVEGDGDLAALQGALQRLGHLDPGALGSGRDVPGIDRATSGHVSSNVPGSSRQAT